MRSANPALRTVLRQADGPDGRQGRTGNPLLTMLIQIRVLSITKLAGTITPSLERPAYWLGVSEKIHSLSSPVSPLTKLVRVVGAGFFYRRISRDQS